MRIAQLITNINTNPQTTMERQYCCFIERRFAAVIIGFTVITEAYFGLPVQLDWDTISNLILGHIAGVVVLLGIYQSKKEYILIYLGVEIVHIFVLFISCISAFAESSKIVDVRFHWNEPSESALIFLGFLYLILWVLHIFFWRAMYTLYKIFDEYARIPYLVDLQNMKGSQ